MTRTAGRAWAPPSWKRWSDSAASAQCSQTQVASRRSADFYERIGYRSSADFLKRTF